MAALAAGESVNNPFGRMVYDDYLARTRKLYQERASRIESIRTRRQAEFYRDEVAEAAVRCFGPFPGRTPLNPRITGELEGHGFRIEKILFESRPHFWVSANLYIPEHLKAAAPAVLGSCGHAPEGKAAAPYQSYAQELAQCGFVVLLFDPISQGERDQFYSLGREDKLSQNCVHAHNMMGKQLDLSGDYFGNWRAWDAIRALDYLQSREEVDPDRIAMTGNSGGGTMTLWLWALDRRIRMIGTSCFVTTFLSNIENELPQDAEQYPPGMLAKGLEMADFLIARAPDPAIVLAQRYCFFDRRGTAAAAKEVARVYRLLRRPGQFIFFLGSYDHGYHADARAAMVRFFCKHEGSKPVVEPQAVPFSPEVLNASREGQVLPAGSQAFQDVHGEIISILVRRRKRLSAEQLQRRLGKLLGLAKLPAGPISYRILRPHAIREELVVSRYAINTERNIDAILFRPFKELGRHVTLDVEESLILYIPDLSSMLDIEKGMMATLARETGPCYAVDVRGTGESIPSEAGDFLQSYGMDYMFHGLGVMMGESYLGRRVFDLLQVCRLLRQEGARSITLVGRRQGALIALFAAILDPRIERTELCEALPSFETLARSMKADWPASHCLRSILRYFDLPDLYKAYGERIKIIQD